MTEKTFLPDAAGSGQSSDISPVSPGPVPANHGQYYSTL